MMELDVFPDALREQAVAIGSVLKMEMSEDDKVHPRPGLISIRSIAKSMSSWITIALLMGSLFGSFL